MTRRRDANSDKSTHTNPNRRGFLGYLGLSPGLTGLAGTTLLGLLEAPSAFANLTPINAAERRNRAFILRRDAAIFERDLPHTPSVSNGDEELYPNRIANYTKGLPHSDLGEVDLNA